MNIMFTIYSEIWKKNNDLQLLISSYLAGNKSKDLYNEINEFEDVGEENHHLCLKNKK